MYEPLFDFLGTSVEMRYPEKEDYTGVKRLYIILDR